MADDKIPSLTDPWKPTEIVYTSIITAVMLAALLEWFLWLAAFIYCLIKAFKKADHWSSRVLAVIIMIVFTALRCIFLPVMVVTLPLPSRITQHFPEAMVQFLQWFAFWSFAALLTIPWLFCVYQLVTHNLGRTSRLKTVLDESTAPKVVIVMPCYNEIPEVLMTAIDSIVDGDYPPSCVHIFLSFDGDDVGELYLGTIKSLGVPLTLNTYPKSLDIVYRGMRVTVSRFPHGGKRHCQKQTFRLIDKVYEEYLKRNDNLFILFIDSDCILDKVCIQNFMYEMELKPGSKKNMIAMTGVITSTAKKQTLITLLQDMEYIHGQLFERSVESACGSVTCLPGALTILRFSAFREMSKEYFADKAERCEDLFDFGKCHLGEDRWLTHLFMIGAKERYQIQICTSAFCKTEAVLTYKSLLKQRRRWFLGFITNEVCMLTDWRLWRKYPILCVVRFMQNTIRTTALLFLVMVLSLITTTQKISQLPVGFIAVSLGLNWGLMIYFGFVLKRFKAWGYPLMFILNPFFNWVYMVYGIFTAGQRTWGGPRADAKKADENTTPEEAAAQAEAMGDDLEVIPETFRPAAQARNQGLIQRRAGGPQDYTNEEIDGHLAAPVRLPNGFYNYGNESIGTLPDFFPRNPDVPHIPLHPRISFDSVASGHSPSPISSMYMPRRVESIMGEEDRRKYLVAQAGQREAGGAYMEPTAYYNEVYGYKNANQSTDSINSSSSYYAYPGGHSQDSYSLQNYTVNKDPSSASSSARGSPEAPANDPSSGPEIAKLSLPEAAHVPRSRSANPPQRSPLGRMSLARTASHESGESSSAPHNARNDDSTGERQSRRP